MQCRNMCFNNNHKINKFQDKIFGDKTNLIPLQDIFLLANEIPHLLKLNLTFFKKLSQAIQKLNFLQHEVTLSKTMR